MRSADSGTVKEHRNPQERFVSSVRSWVFLLNVFSGQWLGNHLKAITFNYPADVIAQEPLIVSSYTCAMARAVFPYDAKSLFEGLTKPFLLIIGDKDEQFVADQVVKYKEYAGAVKDSSRSEIIEGAAHMTILLEAAKDIASFMQGQ